MSRLVEVIFPFIIGIGVYFFIFGFNFLLIGLPVWNLFRKIAQKFEGKLNITFLGGIRCEFKYKSILIKIQTVPRRRTPPRIVIDAFKSFNFKLRITPKETFSALLKKSLWGPFSEDIHTGILELDEKFLFYTKDKAYIRNYLSNAYIQQAIIHLFEKGWQDLYFTHKGVRIEKDLYERKGISLNKWQLEDVNLFLEDLSVLTQY
jgi:hypothetical protein